MVGEYYKGTEDAPAPDVYDGNELYDTTVDAYTQDICPVSWHAGLS